MIDLKNYCKDKLNIPYEGTIHSNSFIINLKDSTQYGIVYSKMENNNDISEIQEESIISPQASSIRYESITEPYEFTLSSDFSIDNYKFIAKTRV